MPRKLKPSETLGQALLDIWLELLLLNGLPLEKDEALNSSTLGELGAYFSTPLGGCIQKIHALNLFAEHQQYSAGRKKPGCHVVPPISAQMRRGRTSL